MSSFNLAADLHCRRQIRQIPPGVFRLVAVAAPFLLLLATQRDAVAVERPPNIVLVLADDVGCEPLGCYGGSSCKTPHLDKLATGGLKFRHCYAMPVCHPTRVTLLTGRYPFRLGHPRWGSFPKTAESQTVAQLLKRFWVRTPAYKLYSDGKFFDMVADPNETQQLEPGKLPPAAAQVFQQLRTVRDELAAPSKP